MAGKAPNTTHSLARRRLTGVAVDMAAWAFIHTATAYLAYRVPDRWYDRDRALFRERPFERSGRWYVDVLGVRRWKAFLPDAGSWFSGGFAKRDLAATDPAYLATFVRETRRAELGHWLALGAAPAFFGWNPWYAALVQQAWALALNVPCIAAQRYNRIRLQRALAFTAGRRHRATEAPPG